MTMEKDQQKSESNEISVDAQTFYTIQLAKIDNDIADAELQVAIAQSKVAELKKNKTQISVDFYLSQIKQASQTVKTTEKDTN